MKALELKVFPLLKRPRYGYGIDPYREQWKRERKVILSKRLTDAELAAEYWREAREFLTKCESSAQRLDRIHRWTVMHRFATLPHYDEEL